MRQDALSIIDSTLNAVRPDAAVRNILSKMTFPSRVILIAIGKAAWAMSASAASTLAENNIPYSGALVTKYGHSQGPIPHLQITEAGHPIPDQNTLLGTQKILNAVSTLQPSDTVLFLVSGGGSALFEQPQPGVTLSDMEDITRQLLRCAADITEINTIRKRLSAVKAGRFAQLCAPAHIHAIILSDVLGDRLDTIASGPATPDTSTVADALAVIKKYNLQCSEPMLELLHKETPKTLQNVQTHIIGSVSVLCEAASQAAKTLGYHPYLLATTLDCEAREAGRTLAAIARQVRAENSPFQLPCAILIGGETVVHVTGQGLGGRNQELALAAAPGIAGLPNTLIFSLGSDGTDGPTDAAGGIVDQNTASTLAAAGISIDTVLADNDAYHALAHADGLLMTGPTGTNVNDIAVLLCK